MESYVQGKLEKEHGALCSLHMHTSLCMVINVKLSLSQPYTFRF